MGCPCLGVRHNIENVSVLQHPAQIRHEMTVLDLPARIMKGLPDSVINVIPQVDGSELCK